MITEINDTKLEVLTGRIINGIEFCNTTWQRARATEDTEQFKQLMKLLDSGSSRLHILISVAWLHGLDGCVFGNCKYSFEESGFTCFGCSVPNKPEASQ